MKTVNQKTGLLPRVYCSVFGHDFRVSKKVTAHVKEYTCSHCNKEVTTTANGRLTDLTPAFKEINSNLGQLYYRRSMHKTMRTAS